MVAKYKKYWEVVSYTFCFGAIMDPMIKLNGLELILSETGKNLEIIILMTSTSIQKNFNDTSKFYAKKYADTSVQSCQTSHRPSPSESNACSSQAVFGLLASKTKQRIIGLKHLWMRNWHVMKKKTNAHLPFLLINKAKQPN
ncbi:hypothetical protein ACLB2K_016419 [Fragaria x ananassa]